MHDPQCVFCQIWQGELPHRLLHVFNLGSPDAVRVFTPLDEIEPDHVILVPRVHFAYGIQNPRLAGIVTQCAHEFAAMHPERYGPADDPHYHVVNQNGKRAFQTVFHHHTHLYDARGQLMPWTYQRRS